MRVLLGTAAVAVFLAAGSVMAAGVMSPQQIVDDRLVGMKGLVENLKAAKGATDPAIAKAQLAQAIAFAQAIPSKFPKGTGVGDAGVTKTRALQDIWTKPSEFQAAADAMVVALKNADAVAGDATKFAAAFGEIPKGCGGCHTPFRGPVVP